MKRARIIKREELDEMPAQNKPLDPKIYNQKTKTQNKQTKKKQQQTHKHLDALCPFQHWINPALFFKSVYLSRLTIIILFYYYHSRLTLIFIPKKSLLKASPNLPYIVLMLHKAECISLWNKTVTHVF